MSSEAAAKRRAALDACGPFQTSDAANVRWLLCGRGRPVAAGTSPYAVRVTESEALVLYQDIERSRVEAEERWEGLGFAATPYPWHEFPPDDGLPEPELAHLRRALAPEELDRYRAAGADAAAALVAALGALTPELPERAATAVLARHLVERGFTTPVLLAGGDRRAPLHRHPLPTDEPLGRFALLAFTAERDGLHLSLTRIVSFGAPPAALRERVAQAAEVDAAVLAASRPRAEIADLFDVIARAYADVGLREHWRRHHQGGITGYAGREVFATPGDLTRLPERCAVAWNPSVTGGGKSEDTALVTAEGVEVVTRTTSLPELQTAAGVARADVVEL